MSRKSRRLPAALVLAAAVLLISGIVSKRILRPARPLPAEASPEGTQDRCRVVTVYDGDTIAVRDEAGTEIRVRLIGVDCPEMRDSREEVRYQAFLAKRFAFHHLYGKDVLLTYDWERRDVYGRTLAYVWFDGETLFNGFIIEQGFSPAFLRYPFRQDYRDSFSRAERTARIRERGLWKPEPYPLILPGQAEVSLGEVVRVRFNCESIERARGFTFLVSDEGRFAVLIPDSERSLFPDVETWSGRSLTVQGYLEEFRGQFQVLVAFPFQVEVGRP